MPGSHIHGSGICRERDFCSARDESRSPEIAWDMSASGAVVSSHAPIPAERNRKAHSDLSSEQTS